MCYTIDIKQGYQQWENLLLTAEDTRQKLTIEVDWPSRARSKVLWTVIMLKVCRCKSKKANGLNKNFKFEFNIKMIKAVDSPGWESKDAEKLVLSDYQIYAYITLFRWGYLISTSSISVWGVGWGKWKINTSANNNKNLHIKHTHSDKKILRKE